MTEQRRPNVSGTTRRQFLGRGAATVGTGLYGMSGGLTVLKTQLTPKALAPDGDLYLFNWAQYMSPKVIKGFEKEYKLKVHQSFFTNMQGMMAKLRAGVGYDVTIPEADYAQQLAQANYLLELDQSKLPNFKNIAAPFQNPWYDPGAKHSIPYSIWTTGIFWNKKALGPMTGSWNDLWKSAAKAKGKIWLLDDMKEVIGMSLLRNHQPISSTDKSQVDRATAEVLKLKPAVRGFTTLTDPMTSGQGVMQHFWSGTSYQVLSQVKHPEQWSFETAKEGVPVGSDAVVIPKNAPHKNTAQLFLNWLLAPENASINPLATGYPMMTAASLATYGKMVKQYPFLKITIPEVQHGEHFTPLSGSALAMYSANWAKIKA